MYSFVNFVIIFFRPKDPSMLKFRTPVDGVEIETTHQAVSVL